MSSGIMVGLQPVIEQRSMTTIGHLVGIDAVMGQVRREMFEGHVGAEGELIIDRRRP